MTGIKTFHTGPFDGVLDTPDPGDDTSAATLQDLLNGYLADARSGSGAYSRPGFSKAAPSLTTNGVGQACTEWTHTALDGTVYRFAAANGKLWRLSGTGFVTAVDVTPIGVTIDNSTAPTCRFYMRSYANSLIFTDGVHRPWIGTNLGSTPITGTYIDIDGSGAAWTSTAPPVEYKGSLIFIATTYGGSGAVQGGVAIVYCEPNQPSVGYIQSGYADFWNVIQQTGGQTGSMQLQALSANNTELIYFREYSIGAITGTPSINFSTTATTDAISQNVGTRAPGAVVQFQDNTFFVDVMGRPWLYVTGATPRPIWEQMRGQYQATPSLLANPTATALVAVGSIVPQLNVVVLSGWSSDPVGSPVFGPLGPNTLYAFAQDTGTYQGRWQGASTLSTFDALAVMKDPDNNPTLTALCLTGLAMNIWYQGLLSSGVWKDNAVTLPVTATTQRLGYTAHIEYTLQGVRSVTSNVTPVALTTVATNGTVSQGTQTPPSSSDGTFLAQWLPDATQGRGFQLQISPTTTTSQWALYLLEAYCTSAEIVAGDR